MGTRRTVPASSTAKDSRESRLIVPETVPTTNAIRSGASAATLRTTPRSTEPAGTDVPSGTPDKGSGGLVRHLPATSSWPDAVTRLMRTSWSGFNVRPPVYVEASSVVPSRIASPSSDTRRSGTTRPVGRVIEPRPSSETAADAGWSTPGRWSLADWTGSTRPVRMGRPRSVAESRCPVAGHPSATGWG